MNRRRFVVLDRDGTLIVERNYLADPNQVALLPGAVAALQRFRDMGLGLVVVTNQSGVGRGLFTLEQMQRVHERMVELLQAEGVTLDGIYFCPHTPETGCACRKPNSGLIHQAVQELGFTPVDSFVIGDKPCDIELGKAIGATTLLVRTGYGEQFAAAGNTGADHVVDDLTQAADTIQRLL